MLATAAIDAAEVSTPGLMAAARLMNSSTAGTDSRSSNGDPSSPGIASGGTGRRCSPVTFSAS